MSQNYFQSNNRVAMIGWDRPTQCAYVIVGELDNSKTDWNHPLLIDRDFDFDRVNNMHHIDEIVLAIRNQLSRQGEIVPDSVFQALAEDIQADSSNIQRLHYADKSSVAFNGNPFTDKLFV